MKKGSKILGRLMSYSIIAFSVYILLGVMIQKEEFYIFGYRPVLVLSGSMEPYMETNSIAIVQKTKDINEGDVVMFRIDEDTRVCHRAVDIDAEGNITTKGDNNEKADYDKVLWSSIFVTLMANKIGGLQFGIYRNCQISSRVFHTAVAALPLTKANRSDFE